MFQPIFSALKKPNIQVTLSALLLLAIVSTLRFYNLSHDSLWLDEINSLLVATVHGYPQTLPQGIWTPQQWFESFLTWQPMDWSTLMAMLKQNVHMPLYYLLLNPWLKWFGLNETGLRSFSAVFSVLTLAAIWRFTGTLTRHSHQQHQNEKIIYWPLLTLCIAGLAPFQLTFAQEGRMYTLALFFSVLSAWFLLRWTQRCLNNANGQKRSLAIYTVSTLLGMFTHYTFIFQIGFHGVWVLYQFFKSRQKLLLGFLIPVSLLGIFAYFWAPIYLAQKFTAAQEHHFSAGLLDWHRYLQVLITTPFYWWAGFVNNTQYLLLPFYISAIIYSVIQLIKRFTSSSNRSISPVLPFLLLWLWVPLLGQIFVDVIQQTHTATIVRYTLLSSPAIYILLGYVAANFVNRLTINTSTFRKFKTAVPYLLSLVCILFISKAGLSTVDINSAFRYKEKFPTRDVAAYLDQTLGEKDLIAINGPLATPALLAFYLKDYRPEQPMYYWATLPRFKAVPKQPTPEQFRAYDSTWLYFNRGNRRRGALTLRDILDKHYGYFYHHIGPRNKLSVYTHASRNTFGHSVKTE